MAKIIRDGHGDNNTANWGVEGPTDDPAIRALRASVVRAILATVFFSNGTPMLLAGDEFGRTQQGNNNAYCQDTPISWLDWELAASVEGRALIAFTTRLIKLRHAHPILRCAKFLYGKEKLPGGLLDIAWFDDQGGVIPPEAWNDPEQTNADPASRLAQRRRHDPGVDAAA